MVKPIIIIVLFMMFLQTLLSIYQIKYYEKFVKEIAKKYSSRENYLYTEMSSNKFNRLIVVIVIDEHRIVIDAYKFHGKFWFSKFVQIPEIIGLELYQNTLNEVSLNNKIKDVLTKIIERIPE
ncbi:transcriptional regulator GutM [Ignavigranum ruoffiae]|uniref:transcriptional regulator GutM n=1 Tax=Ignavigranum ruoffiae TaxID=89093 RepID=UPI0024AE52FC|nr:transcriptional regulator GutM [Ignavigranum ruoffiae]